MTRTQRLNLKKKLKRQTRLSVAMILIFILNIVLLVTIKWRPEAMSDAESMSDAGLGLVFFVLIVLMAPLFLAFIFNVHSTWTLRELYDVRRNINTERNKMYVRRVFEHVKKEEFEEAIAIHNNFVFGSAKVITRGVLIGALFFKGGDEDHKRAVLNMEGIVEKEM